MVQAADVDRIGAGDVAREVPGNVAGAVGPRSVPPRRRQLRLRAALSEPASFGPSASLLQPDDNPRQRPEYDDTRTRRPLAGLPLCPSRRPTGGRAAKRNASRRGTLPVDDDVPATAPMAFPSAKSGWLSPSRSGIRRPSASPVATHPVGTGMLTAAAALASTGAVAPLIERPSTSANAAPSRDAMTRSGVASPTSEKD